MKYIVFVACQGEHTFSRFFIDLHFELAAMQKGYIFHLRKTMKECNQVTVVDGEEPIAKLV
ncbi:MAG: hypothetical protein J6B12_02310 [Clostridia bacterium]|nr:hypothetical protein [Clostridia bacterium]